MFLVALTGQVISATGARLTNFVLSLHVYQRTGSVTQFALTSLATVLPTVLLSPFAGVFVDRGDRKRALLLSEAGSGVCTLLLLAVLHLGELELWHINCAVAAISVFNVFQMPAFASATTLLVPREQLGRASGLYQMGEALGELLSPVLAGLLVVSLELSGILWIDVGTYSVALLLLLFVRIPRTAPGPQEQETRRSLLGEASYGLRYIRQRPGLLGLLVMLWVGNFSLGIVWTLLTPMLLSFTTEAVLGTVLSFSGLGMVAGSVLMSVWGGPARLVHGVLGFLLLQGVVLFSGGLQPSVPLVATAAFVFSFCIPLSSGCNMALWQRKVEPSVQGRVFAVRRMVVAASSPVAYVIAGPLADHVFEPLLAPGGPLAMSLGRVIGTGTGRGIGLMFMVLGLGTVLATVIGSLHPRLRHAETELADAVPEDLYSQLSSSEHPPRAEPQSPA
ncbi:MFS transporter [Cystobacter fuscus]|uniref:Multidrug efflux pump Tap n=1 Tax=Cystobacter fuscus TaxID=43 RepID=A0A250JBY5_9BACT|nr:MFS transporter [Cystobacter fuscus]ATB41113.1 MFS transporter [Cystobacter fuscus]